MSEIKSRLALFLEKQGIPKEKFYTDIGMTSANFRGDAKKSPLNSDAIENILSKIPLMNPYWLITGDGEMLLPESTNNEPPPEKKHNEMEERLIFLLEQSAKEKERLLEIIDRQNKQIADLQADKKSGGGIFEPLKKEG